MIEQILIFIAILISIITFIVILLCFMSYQFHIATLADKIEIPIDNVKDITDELYNRSEDKPTGLFGGSTLVDNAWTCSCGQLNAEYRQECGKCKMIVNEING